MGFPANVRKRAAYKQRVQEALQRILNDPTVMPNADCGDLVTSVTRIEFGRTVRDIFIDVSAVWRSSEIAASAHDRYMREAEQRGEETYADLDEVMFFGRLRDQIAIALQKELGLRYTPNLRRLDEL